MPVTSLTYRALTHIAHALLPVAARLHPKVRRGREGRRNLQERLETGLPPISGTGAARLWFHAPSVGEGLQAESVISAVRARHADAQIIFTHFSPSAEAWARRLDADLVDYLPYDRRVDVDRALDALQPDGLVFTKLDLWPELATRAAARGVAVFLVAGTVQPGSGRLRWPARALLRPGYAAVTAAAAVASDDRLRLIRLGVDRASIQVLGDPRFDSVAQRVASVASAQTLPQFTQAGRSQWILVAGSTWPSDEQVVVEAFASVRSGRASRDLGLVLVPHEPTPGHLAGIDALAARLDLPRPVRLSALGDANQSPSPTPFPSLVVVDRVGLLAGLYGIGKAAFIGGGFRRAGLHSVLEPAAWGVPVACGPGWSASRDARLLVDAGAAFPLRDRNLDRASREFTETWRAWLADEDGRVRQGQRARQVIEEGLGASARTADLIEAVLVERHGRGTITPS